MSSAIASTSRQTLQRRAFGSITASSSRRSRASSVHNSSSTAVGNTGKARATNVVPEPWPQHGSSRFLQTPSRAAATEGPSAEVPVGEVSKTRSNLSRELLPSNPLPPLARHHPNLYAATRPQSATAIAALAARLHLLSPSQSKEEQDRILQLVSQACTHPSFAHVLRRAKDAQRKVSRPGEKDVLILESEEQVRDNAHLSALGNSLLGLLGGEALHIKYPHLPTRVLKAALSAYVGPNTTADVGSELGLAGQGVLRWDRGDSETDAAAEQLRFRARLPSRAPAKVEKPESAITSKEARSSAVRALLGLIYQERGLDAVKRILHSRFLSRTVDLAAMLKFQDPKRVLSNTCAKYGRERPQSRLIAETGRLSRSPLFVVGVYSGQLKLGEGLGSSIKMAEFRAAEDALRRLYLAQAPFELNSLPSATLQTGGETVEQKPAHSYVAPPLGASEVMHGSRD